MAVLALFSVPNSVYNLFKAAPIQRYDDSRSYFISRLNASSTCLAARLYYDGLHHLETDCKLDVTGLSDFSRRFAPYMAVTPYSGAWNIEKYARRVEDDAKFINRAGDRSALIALQKIHGFNFAETAYYLCGIEWYMRSAPPEKLGVMAEERVRSYQDAWKSWEHETGDHIRNAPFEATEFKIKDDPDCGSFIDLLD